MTLDVTIDPVAETIFQRCNYHFHGWELKWIETYAISRKKYVRIRFFLPTWLSIPSKISIKKNKPDHNCGIGILASACGKTTKTSPGPSAMTSSTETPCSRARLPIVEKTHKPQMIHVMASTTTTINVSLRMGPWNGL